MIDPKTPRAIARSQRRSLPQRDPNHPLPMWPVAHIYPEPGESETNSKAKRDDRKQRDDDVAQLARALRAARRAHCAYLTELLRADVEPIEDWSTWYAEYLLGVR